uniref:Uncharacterized protein n=2 Tax=Clastoptera arizonana TaxID=38151 RepID=A0A1B6DBM6_9HEMI
MEQKNEHTPVSPKQKRSISNSDTIENSQDVTNLRERIHNHTSSFGSYDKPKLHKLLARRQSSSSGQWKGVRWKPIIDDAAGDTWSDNAERRSSIAVCTNCKQMPLESVDVMKSPPAVPPRSTSLFSNSVDSIASSYQSLCTAASYNEPSTLSKTQSKSFPYFPLGNGDDTASVRSSTVSSSLPNILSGSASTINIDSHSQSKHHQDSKTLNENLSVHETKEQLNSNFNNLSNL